MATPTPSSNSRTKPSTKEAGCGCQATVIELFSALQSSARILGAPGAVKRISATKLLLFKFNYSVLNPRHLLLSLTAPVMRFCLISPSPFQLGLSYPLFLSCLVSSRRLIVYYGVQLFPVNQNAPLRARRLACQVVARNSIEFRPCRTPRD